MASSVYIAPKHDRGFWAAGKVQGVYVLITIVSLL